MRTVLGMVGLVLVLGLSATAQAPLAVYDSFSGSLIDPAKWFGAEAAGGTGTEAIRQIVGGRLRMFYRSYGGTASNSDVTSSSIQLRLANPDPVTAIKGVVAIRAFTMTACPANLEPARVRVRIGGTFFNAGTPTPGSFLNDVFARIRLQRRSDSADPPGVFRVQASAFQCTDAACDTAIDIGFVDMGSVNLGQPASVMVRWDADFDQFFFQFGSTTAIMPYSVPDSSPPGVPGKRLDLQLLPPNCLLPPRPMASLDAFFDDIMVNASALSSLTGPAPTRPSEPDR